MLMGLYQKQKKRIYLLRLLMATYKNSLSVFRKQLQQKQLFQLFLRSITDDARKI